MNPILLIMIYLAVALPITIPMAILADWAEERDWTTFEHFTLERIRHNINELAAEGIVIIIIFWPLFVAALLIAFLFFLGRKIKGTYPRIKKRLHKRIYKWHLRSVLIELSTSRSRRDAWDRALRDIVHSNFDRGQNGNLLYIRYSEIAQLTDRIIEAELR